LAEGARVMLVDLDSASLPGIVADLSTEREDFVAADVMDAEQTRNYVEKTIKRFGKIDMLGDRIDGRWRVLRLTASS
jgi:NADP-dependent 3-hydroxy acid dehydrogenase YdfG